MKLLAYLEEEYLLMRDVSDSTETHYRITINSFGRWLGRSAMLGDLNSARVNEWLRSLKHEGKSPATVRSKRGDLLVLWRAAYESRHIDEAPRGIRRIKQPDRIPCSWSPLEMRRLLATTQQLDTYLPNGIQEGAFWDAFVRVTYDTGLRLSDALSLKMAAISADGRVNLVQQKSSRRLQARIRQSTIDALEAIPHPDGLALAFPFGRSAFWDRWRKLLTLAGLPTGRREGPQKIRRTSATELSRVAGPDAASSHLGHSRHSHGLAERNYLSDRAFPSPPLPPDVA